MTHFKQSLNALYQNPNFYDGQYSAFAMSDFSSMKNEQILVNLIPFEEDEIVPAAYFSYLETLGFVPQSRSANYYMKIKVAEDSFHIIPVFPSKN